MQFNQTGPPRRVNVWPFYRKIKVKKFSQEHSELMNSLKTEPRFDNLGVAKLRFYPLSCIAAYVVGTLEISTGMELATLRLLFVTLTDLSDAVA